MARVLLVLACLCACPPLRAQDSDFQRVFTVFGEGRTTDALVAAEELQDPVERSQARTYVLYQCGDLAGAWRAAGEGLQASPNDVYLLQQIAELSVSLGAGDAAVLWSERFSQAVSTAGRTDLEPAAKALADSADELQIRGRARDASMTRARTAAGVLIGLAVVALGALVRG